MANYTILGKDPYWMNFIGLMVLTLIEVVAVGFHLPDERIFVFSNYTLMILTVIAIPKFIMIALIFMHLYGEDDSGILTVTALFPSFFIIIMILFIGLTHPEATLASQRGVDLEPTDRKVSFERPIRKGVADVA